MPETSSNALIVLVVGVLGCGPDAREAPGCPVGVRQCAGDVIQVCATDARTRTSVWFDVVDCSETNEVCVPDGGTPGRAWPYCEEADREAVSDEMSEEFE